MRRETKCTVEEKVAAVEDYLNGTRSVSEIMIDLCMKSTRTIRDWILAYQNGGIEALCPVTDNHSHSKEFIVHVLEKELQEIRLNKSVHGFYIFYHYSYADSIEDAKLEAEFCLENIQGMQFEYPIVFDIEDKEQLKLDNRQRTDIVKAFCEEIKNMAIMLCFTVILIGSITTLSRTSFYQNMIYGLHNGT